MLSAETDYYEGYDDEDKPAVFVIEMDGSIAEERCDERARIQSIDAQ